MRAALLGLALGIAAADLAQVVLLDKGMGAVAGAMIYGTIAGMVGGAGRSRIRLGAGVAAAMPLIPIAVFTGLLGSDARETLVDAGMIGVFILQVAASIAGIGLLWQTRRDPQGPGTEG